MYFLAFFPSGIDFFEYKKYIHENYPIECYKLFEKCLELNANYFNANIYKTAETARIDIINRNNKNSSIEFINCPEYINVEFPDWFKVDDGEGAVLETKIKSFDVKLKCINSGLLNIYLRGPDVRNLRGERVPSYVNYKKGFVEILIFLEFERIDRCCRLCF